MHLKAPLRVHRRPTGVLQLIVAFGAIVATLCLGARTVKALDANANTAEGAWCVERDGVPPTCTYNDFLTCAVTAIRGGGSCKARSSIPVTAIDANPNRTPALSRRSTRSTNPHRAHDPSRISTLSNAERERLFRKFVEWSRRRSDQ